MFSKKISGWWNALIVHYFSRGSFSFPFSDADNVVSLFRLKIEVALLPQSTLLPPLIFLFLFRDFVFLFRCHVTWRPDADALFLICFCFLNESASVGTFDNFASLSVLFSLSICFLSEIYRLSKIVYSFVRSWKLTCWVSCLQQLLLVYYFFLVKPHILA